MPILTDEPLIDDSELDDFDWDACLAILNKPQPLTWRGNIMKSYHLFMHTVALSVSAVLFKGASSVLGAAVTHKQKLDKLRGVERMRSIGYSTPKSWSLMEGYENLGPLTADEQEFIRQHELLHRLCGQPLTKWIDAEPCSDYQEVFDPVHPDYVPYSEK